MELIKELEKIDNSRLIIYVNSLFEKDLENDLFYFAKKHYAVHSAIFTKFFGEKWWKANFEKLETISEDKVTAIEKSLTDAFTSFMANYEQRDKEAHDKTLEMREYLKAGFESCGTYSDHTKRKTLPPIAKSVPENAIIVELPEPSKDVIKQSNIFDCIGNRESRRKFTDEEVSLDELSYLLWATQGVRKSLYNDLVTLRNAASGGARQPFETYLFINKVTGLETGIYRYQALSHSLVFLYNEENIEQKVTEASHGQSFAGNCAVCFIWSTIPYRCEYKYMTEAKKIIAQDSGHLCQNLYLAVESIECGTCAIGAYSQSKMDNLLRLDGVDEFVVYVAPVGKV